MPEPILETPRLILRPPVRDEFESWVGLYADAEAARSIGGVCPRAMVWRHMMTMAGSWALQGFAMFSVIEKETGRWIGRLGPWMPDSWPGPEVGWALVRDAWGKGYAAEGAAAAIDWALAELGWTEVIHSIDPSNAPSQALARRLGSTNRGPGRLPPPFEQAPIEIWGQTKAEWAVNRRAFR